MLRRVEYPAQEPIVVSIADSRDAHMQTVDGKPADEALRQSEARTHAILATAVDALIVIGETGTVETFNPGAERVFGYAAASGDRGTTSGC